MTYQELLDQRDAARKTINTLLTKRCNIKSGRLSKADEMLLADARKDARELNAQINAWHQQLMQNAL